jgi:hypothetical protein
VASTSKTPPRERSSVRKVSLKNKLKILFMRPHSDT